MRKRHIATVSTEEEENEINLTPMLDVVFIMLIFFIVTASFIRESGLEASRPDQSNQPQVTDEDGAILVMISDDNRIFVDNQAVDIRQVQPRIAAMYAEDAERPMVVQTHPDSHTETLISVLDQANLVGIENVSIVELN